MSGKKALEAGDGRPEAEHYDFMAGQRPNQKQKEMSS